MLPKKKEAGALSPACCYSRSIVRLMTISENEFIFQGYRDIDTLLAG
jgi:hypothetical protein